ncbi:hypothetical protein Pflav_000050 [Phytohabitans flavus]|uniref:Uncharacterized protein n=1 Tax=Phytohabitans flavus TaxID=1076124 RepID=A0A6F8XIF8_9ACTN|nr:hypothetical protein Pflav_000050 [Phytohabitans flavus]
MASGPAEPGETPWAMDTTGWWHNAFLLLYLLQQFAVENVLPSERDTLIELAVRPRKGTARKGLCEILQMTGREAFLDPGHGARVRDAARSTPVKTTPQRCTGTDSAPLGETGGRTRVPPA